jgi:hypothetical protein
MLCPQRSTIPMTNNGAWLATLVEQILSQYLTTTDPNLSTPSPSPIEYYEGLSNTLISPDPSLLRTVNLLEFRKQAKEVKGVIGDAEHHIRATFTKEALNEPITAEGVPFTHLQVGAVFKILACQVRVSDCFDPPKVDIRIPSFAVVSLDGGPTGIAHLKRVEDDPSVLMNLVEYNLRHNRSMADSDDENHEPLASQEDYQTQMPYLSLKAPSPRRPSPQKPTTSDQSSAQLPGRDTTRKTQTRPLINVSINALNRDSRDICPTERHSSPVEKAVTEPAPSAPQPMKQTPVQRQKLSDSDSSPHETTSNTRMQVNASQSSPNGLAMDVLGPLCNLPTVRELLRQEPKADTKRLMVVRDVCYQNRRATTDLGTMMKELGKTAPLESDDLSEDLTRRETRDQEHDRGYSERGLRTWTRTTTTRWPPRYANWPKEQHVVINDDASWDPPLVGQPSIKGQVPLKLLERVCRTVDRIAGANHKSRDIRESSASEDSPVKNSQLRTSAQTPPPASSPISWSQTPDVSPERPIQARPRLPPDSSPLKSVADVAEDRATVHLPSNVDKSPASSSSGDQETPSSSPLQAVYSEDEDSLMPDDNDNEPSVPPRTEMPNELVSPEDEAPARANAGHLPEASLGQIGERTSVRQARENVGEVLHQDSEAQKKHYGEMIINVSALNSSNSSAPQHATSNLESTRSIQVRRTPVVQRRNSDTSSAFPDHQLDYMNARQGDRAFPLATLSQGFPPSSLFVPGTSVPKLPAKDIAPPSPNLRKSIPPPNFGQPKSEEKPMADITMTGTDGDSPEELRKKRKHPDTTSEDNSKRRRINDESYNPVFRGKDPDYESMELRLRQEQNEGIEEIKKQKEEDRFIREEHVRMTATIRDDQSVESRGRALSPRSSVLSLARQHVSTPITRSSGYRSAASDKVGMTESTLKDTSTGPVAAQDVFESFKLQNSGYTGGRKQFDKACQLIRLLRQPPSRAPPVFAWDDFVFRYNEDYLDYQAMENEAGRVPILYEAYYSNFEEQVCNSKIITLSYISSLSDRSSVKEGTPSISAHPLRAAQVFERESLSRRDSMISWPVSNSEVKDPQLPPPPPRFEETIPAPKSDSPLEKKPQSQRIDHSQDSSVLMWAEKAADADPPDKIWREKPLGAESPELGTPPVSRETADVPMLDLEAPAPSPAPAVRRNRRISPPSVARVAGRRVPWSSPRETPLSAAPKAPDLAPIRNSRGEKGKGKAPRRHTDFPVRSQEDVVDLTGPVVFQKPRPNAELPMVKLEREFAALDGRKGVLNVSASARKEVDIFAWRR